MKSKKTFLIFCLFIVSQIASAQLFTKEKIIRDGNGGKGSTDKNLLRWGYFLGFNSYDFNFDYNQDLKEIQTIKASGFNVGLIGNLRINNHIDLRLEPGLVISTRELQYDSSYFDPLTLKPSDLIREVKSTYVHIPLLIKFSTKRVNNFKPFIVFGVSTAMNLSGNEKNPNDNFNGQFRTKNNMCFYELGFGIDLYFTNFKFTPSVRGVFAMGDELVRDTTKPNSPWTSNVASMKTQGLFVNFTFQ